MGIYDYEREARQDREFATDNSNSDWSSVYGEPQSQGLQADPKETQRSTNPYSTPTGINWGQGNAQIGGDGGESDDDVSWAPTYSQTAQPTARGKITQGGGGGGTLKPYATIQESTFAPRAGSVAPTFTAPVYNEGEVKARARKMAAPGLSQLNMKVQSAMSRYYENPNVRRMVLRDTLAGYGIGLSNVMAKAQQSAQAEYSAEHSRLYSEAMNSYNVLMGNYMREGNRVTSTRSVYKKGDYEEAMDTKKRGSAPTSYDIGYDKATGKTS
jgi:hypothetical protein